MLRENAGLKARRLLADVRLRVCRAGGSGIEAQCWGDSAERYELGFREGRWFCSCPALGRCSHLVALMLVTVKPP